ncbi:TPA: non-hydrolyzing UDP-N-acetylglucosamine 2-epimerase [Vibrio cholerae]
MKKLKVVTFVGTRPEIIRLSRVIAKLDMYFEHIFVHTGQNYDYELNQIFFDDLEIRAPNMFLECAGGSAAETISQVICKSDALLAEMKPDAVLILGDTNSALSAISAKRHKIPLFHMEAGNRCFDQRVPEEINRKIVDHISDVNMPYSDIAREYLLAEGISPDFIVKTGSPMDEVLAYYKDKIEQSTITGQLNVLPNKYFVVSVHREENVDSVNIHKFVEALNVIGEKYDLPIIVSTHPRTRKKIDALNLEFHKNVQLLKPLGFSDYVRLQKDAFIVLSDSGTITEEASILNLAAVNIRDAQERPEGFEEGAVMFTGMNVDRIIQAISILEDQKASGSNRLINVVKDYVAPNVSDKVVRTILSYTDYINRIVWRRY